MKTYYFFLLMLGFTIPGFTQSHKTHFDLGNARAYNKNSGAAKTSQVNSGWFNYGLAAKDYYGVMSEAYIDCLFPDTLVFYQAPIVSSNPPFRPRVHHLAELVDFKSQVFSAGPFTYWAVNNPNVSLVVDSVSIYYLYTRTQANVTDTLIITCFDGPATGNGNYSDDFILNSFGNPSIADTLSYKALGYNYMQNTIARASNTLTPPVGQKIIKVLLTQSDTASTIFLREKSFAIPNSFITNSNKLFCVDVQFKPGYSYSPNDNISTTANAFTFASYEENGHNSGMGTWMNYSDCGFGSMLCDYSQSYVISQYARYNLSANYNGRYNPALKGLMQYGYEHHLISFHLTDDFTGICQANSQFSVTADTLNPGVYNATESSTGTGSLSYLWDFGDNTSSTQQYPSHQYAVPGQYVVCLTVTSSSGTVTCSDTYCDSSSVHRMAAGFVMNQFNVIDPNIVTGIKNIDNTFYVKAYPNPVNDELIIENSTPATALHYILTDAVGRIIISGSLQADKTTLNTSKLAKGFYNLQIINTNGNLVKTIKLIK